MTNGSYHSARDRAARITTLQRMLRGIGYEVEENGNYDAPTRTAVRTFRQEHGWDVGETVDAALWEAIRTEYGEWKARTAAPEGIRPFPAGSGGVSPGERSDLAAIVRIMLSALTLVYDDWAVMPLCDVYDAETENAVRAFQRIHGMEETGRVDRACWDRMAKEYNRVASDGQ